MSEDQLRPQFTSLTLGLFLAAANLMKNLDRASTTIESLRASTEAQIFRRQIADIRTLFNLTLAMIPANVIPPEERRFLEYWYKQMDL